MRKPNNRQSSTKSWVVALEIIKKELNNNNHPFLYKLFKKHNINTLWGTFLIDNNIVYKKDNLYKWNENIDVTDLLITKYRKYQSEYYKNYSKRKNEQTLFDMPSSPLPPPPKVTKTRKPKIQVKFYDEPKNELGVIRRFLKWLY